MMVKPLQSNLVAEADYCYLCCLAVGVIGLRNESFVVTEADGSIMVYVEFLEPDEISADIVVNATLSTMDDSAFGMQSMLADMYTSHVTSVLLRCV